MKPTQPLKCPYNEFSCAYIDTCGMSAEKSCRECEHYHNGTRATGAMPAMEELYNAAQEDFAKSKKRFAGFLRRMAERISPAQEMIVKSTLSIPSEVAHGYVIARISSGAEMSDNPVENSLVIDKVRKNILNYIRLYNFIEMSETPEGARGDLFVFIREEKQEELNKTIWN